MDNLLEIIIAGVVIAYSVFAEKKKPDQVPDDTDLTAIEDFFKKKNESAQQGQSPSEASVHSREYQEPEPITRVDQAGFFDVAPPPPPPPPMMAQTVSHSQGSKQKRQKKKERSRGQDGSLTPTTSGEFEMPGANWDNPGMPATGKQVEYGKSISGLHAVQTASIPSLAPQTRRHAWDRRRLLDAFILSEVMNRYDINRIYARIPGVRPPQE